VEIFAYAEVGNEDEVTQRYRSLVQHWRTTVGLGDADLARQIREDGIDILVDLAGHTANNRLGVFARKPAPVSLHWLDFGYTTGLTAIDYYLTDEPTAPEGSQELFSETPWRIAPPAFVYRPAEGMGEAGPLPAMDHGHITFGTLTRAVRINHRTIRVWSEILQKVEGSRLIIDSSNFKDPAMQEELAARFIAHGIDRQRLEIGFHSPPWDVLRSLDIMLDCFPHNSGTTLVESLYMGVPYVSLAGRPSVGTLGSSILEGLGHPEWIASTEENYINLAVALAHDLPRLADIRSRLRQEMETSPLMDEAGFARKVETAYQQMFEQWAQRSRRENDLPVAKDAAEDVPADTAEANYHLGQAKVADRQAAAALPYFEAAIDAHPEHGPYWLAYIDALDKAGQTDAARQILKMALDAGLDGTEAEILKNRLERVPPVGIAEPLKLPAEAVPGSTDLQKSALSASKPAVENIDRLISLYQQGRYSEAETLARSLVDAFPEDGQAWNVLSATLRQRGEIVEALSAMKMAVQCMPEDAISLRNTAVLLYELERFAEAEQFCRRALAVDQGYADAHLTLSLILKAQKHLPEAEHSSRMALQLKPDSPEILVELGLILNEQGKFAEAEACCHKALQLNPSFAEAQYSLGLIFQKSDRFQEAESAYRQAIALKANYTEVYTMLGVLLLSQRAFAAAEAVFRQSLHHTPADPNSLHNLGKSLANQNRYPEAESCYIQVLTLEPHNAEAHYNLGIAFAHQGKTLEAEKSYRNALNLNPDYNEAANNLGNNLLQQGRLEEAEAIFRTLLEAHTNSPAASLSSPDLLNYAANNLGNNLLKMGRLEESEAIFRALLESQPNIPMAFSNFLFLLNYHPDKTGEEIFQEYLRFENQFARPLYNQWQEHTNKPDKNRRLKIGYVSPQFRLHSMCYFLEPLLARHDKNTVEVFAYADVDHEDELSKRYRSYVDHWFTTPGLSDAALARKIREDEIDVLVDLAGHTANNRLGVFARKPAPVSLHWLDFGYTTGLTAIDYYLTDKTTAPEGSEGLFSETPWRITTPSIVYRPANGMGKAGPLPAMVHDHITFGTLTRAVRINYRTIRVWSEILKRVKNAHLVINSRNFCDPTVQEELAKKFIAQGVHREQLEIGYHSPPWDVYRSLDISLDCFPHNSGTTLIESLYMGVPYISLAGRPSVGTLGSSILEGVGHPEWIARTEEMYIDLAVALAADIPRLAALRAGLRQEMKASPLMDEPGFARKMEAAYREMFAKWCDSKLASSPKTENDRINGEQVIRKSPKTMKAARSKAGSHPKKTGSPSQIQANRLIELYRQGNIQEAERFARTLIESFPQDSQTWKILGAIRRHQGDLLEALSALETAMKLQPADPISLRNTAVLLCDLERFAEAEKLCAQAIAIKPDYADAHHTLSVSLRALKKFPEAERRAQKALEIRPNYPDALINLALILTGTGRLSEAETCCRKALSLTPNSAEAACSLGSILDKAGQPAEAEAACRQALALKPHYPEAWNSLGGILAGQQRHQEAESAYRRALERKPGYPEALHNLGKTLSRLGRYQEAEGCFARVLTANPANAEASYDAGNALLDQGKPQEAETRYQTALSIKPDYPEALINLGNALQQQGRTSEAEEAFRTALQSDPDSAYACNNLGNVLQEQDKIVESEGFYRRALAIDPHYAEAFSNLGNTLQRQGRLAESEQIFRSILDSKPDFPVAFSNFLFLLNYHPDKSTSEIFQEYIEFDRRFGLPLRDRWQPHGNIPDSKRRLKIGYVSPQFCRHPVGNFLEPLLAFHDKNEVEVYAYAEVYKEDTVTERYRSYMDHWIPTQDMTDAEMAARIRSDGIDILVDLAGHTGHNRLLLFALKPAPISLHWLDFGYTTGLTAIDYYLTDAASVPAGSEELFAETPWRMPTPSIAYRPTPGMGEVSLLPADKRGHITFGSLSRAIRINHRTIRVWAALLKKVQGSHLVINSRDFKDPAMQDRLAEQFVALGVDRQCLEIGFTSPPWDVLRGIDISLDCFPHNSGTTLIESLYMGVPFITLVHRPSVGRLGCSILVGAGHPEWIAESEEQYVDLAVELAADTAKLARIRAGLRQKMEKSPLMDEPGFARRVEAAYRAMFAKWCEGQQ
jgi:protein O-GlcNAc transferase